jgi:threonylcarbamoyladenosine tRNA methylthiotransferase MtaB
MSGQIAKQVKKERTRQMIALGEELSRLFYEENRGSVRPVLWEQAIGADNGGLRWSGYTDNYIRVVANGPQNLFNTVTPTILLAVQGDGVAGEVQGISGG